MLNHPASGIGCEQRRISPLRLVLVAAFPGRFEPLVFVLLHFLWPLGISPLFPRGPERFAGGFSRVPRAPLASLSVLLQPVLAVRALFASLSASGAVCRVRDALALLSFLSRAPRPLSSLGRCFNQNFNSVN